MSTLNEFKDKLIDRMADMLRSNPDEFDYICQISFIYSGTKKSALVDDLRDEQVESITIVRSLLEEFIDRPILMFIRSDRIAFSVPVCVAEEFINDLFAKWDEDGGQPLLIKRASKSLTRGFYTINVNEAGDIVLVNENGEVYSDGFRLGSGPDEGIITFTDEKHNKLGDNLYGRRLKRRASCAA